MTSVDRDLEDEAAISELTSMTKEMARGKIVQLLNLSAHASNLAEKYSG